LRLKQLQPKTIAAYAPAIRRPMDVPVVGATTAPDLKSAGIHIVARFAITVQAQSSVRTVPPS